MAAATATRSPSGLSTDELVLFLAERGEVSLEEVLEKVGEQMVALAWVKGEIEFGRTKCCMTGNVSNPITTHNGSTLGPPTLIIEVGQEWTGPKQRWHKPFALLKGETLPKYPRYQKYQYEVCVNKEKDVWEWLEDGKSDDGREKRYARRDISRAEAEKLFTRAVRLTDKASI